LDIEKPHIEKVSASSIDQIAPNDKNVARNIAEQQSCWLGATLSQSGRFSRHQSNRCPNRSDWSCQKIWWSCKFHANEQGDEEEAMICRVFA
jgi:hypothetical protein